MRRYVSFGVLLGLFLTLCGGSLSAGAQTALPDGIPDGSKKTALRSVVDGDTIEVTLNKKVTVVELAGIDAPEKNECFGDEAYKQLDDLLPTSATIYLEDSGIPNDNGMTAFVWLDRGSEMKPLLINTKMVRDGFAAYMPDQQMKKYGSRLENYEATAQTAAKGVWGACASLHEQVAAAPAPTEAPELASEWTTEEQAYIDGTLNITNYLSPAFDGFSGLMTQAGENPYLLLDADWKMNAALYLAIIKSAYDDGLKLNPPDTLAGVHELFLEGLRLYNVAVDVIATALDNIDADSMSYGATLIQQGNDFINQATELLVQIRTERGI